jgi:gas vesicle protein GvpL/GvpF
VIELYAITDDPGPPMPALVPLRTVASHGLAAVCAPVGEREFSPDQLWHYEQVVEALMEDRDLLPLRFGTRLPDEHAVARALEERHQDLALALEGVRGAVELSVRVLGAQRKPPGGEAVSTGAGYLRAKKQSAAAREKVVRRLNEPLARLARATAQKAPGAEHELMRAAYLVDRSVIESFVQSVADLQDANPELRLLCTGPWPAYSFAER